MLQAWGGPFPDVLFCPTGGITAQTVAQYLALPNVPVCGGTWLTPADAIEAGDWARITRLAQEASRLRAA
jgi:2-dehydro-3-deoxyphosphogluconate aldolase/(4S)-4-hydroxy-2-oxoglutarate aldolase